MECMLKKLCLQAALALAASLASGHAALAADGLRAVATGGVTYSGDDWQVATSSAGKPVLVQGGGKFELGGGVLWQSAQYPVQASLLANYQFDRDAGVNTDAKFTRVPVDAMVYYTGLDRIRIGVGAAYIISPTVKATVDGREQSIKFKNTVGGAFEIGYMVAPDVWTNLRLGSEKYKPKNGGTAQEADITHLSVNVSFLF